MRYFAFLFCLLITLSLGVALSLQFGSVPPLGRLLDPNQGFWQNAFSEDYAYTEQVTLKGLKEPVTVNYDEHLIPHIFAEHEEDLFRVQGFITAKHRLWQMDFQTLAAAGRISEIVGPIALDVDKLSRRKGLPYAAENALNAFKQSDPEVFVLIQAYTDGVNEYINGLSYAELPLEYKILNYRPEEWTPYKSALLLKYMADMLVGDVDLQYTNLRSILGQTLLDKLFPDFPEDNDPVIEAEKRWNFTPLKIERPENLDYPNDKILLPALAQPEPGIGSNNWAVAPKKTKNGHALIANDPHLSLNLPSLWFAMQLSTPNFSVKGATLPGALGVISGFNENIAWGVTNATRDARDWYKIQFKDDGRSEYLYNDRWIQSNLRVEEIKVKGQPTVYDTVVYTHHGPVVYDKNFKGERQDVNVALKWTAHMESNEQKTFLLLNKGKNHQDYLEALDYYTSPAQNFVFASNTGDIAMKVQGRFPLKWEGQGKFIMDGNDPRYEWQGFIPFDQNPSTKNPSRGFVSSANQHSVSEDYPYFVFDNSFEHYRNRRLNERLKSMENMTLEDMKSLQYDSYHLHAAEALPLMMNLLDQTSPAIDSTEVGRYLEKLADWNFNTFPNQEEPTLFNIWWEELYKSVWSFLLQDSVPVVFPNKYQTVQLMMNEPSHELFSRSKKEGLLKAEDHVRKSFEVMVEKIKNWEEEKGEYNWAAYKNTSINHLVPNFESFSRKGIYTGGGSGILNATGSRHGASWRYVAEMGETVTAYGIYPGGQSGNPGSKFYDNFIKIWANGDYVNFNLRSKSDRDELLFSTEFIN
ncbi:penicillin acylase family protein [Arthrospiribacter ruber]|uniref:Penicillin acylase family protein n=1 Tax=Arthrospiribacter ruber TaxID=2487934 RepID=A0A951IPX5_9BACT|nr:penicillin acylase family protein [Arthrospiribacter ruber]MBW3466340.1 penicillin acylase family protein [Arthrospiribacter ruber]